MVEEMKELFQKHIVERLDNPFYNTFSFSWGLWNWKIWYVTFFVDSELLYQAHSKLKIEYLIDIYSWSNHPIFTWAHLLVAPIISATVIVYGMPFITDRFYTRSLRSRNRTEKIKLDMDKEFQTTAEQSLKVSKKVVNLQRAEKEIKAQAKSQIEQWEDDYREFKTRNIFPKFGEVENTVYSRSGYSSNLSSDIKALSDVFGLIEISSDKNLNEKINFTDKGKYFLKRFNQDTSL